MLSARIFLYISNQTFSVLNADQDLLVYDRSEHDYLSNLEQDVSIGDNSEHVFLLGTEQCLLIDGSLD